MLGEHLRTVCAHVNNVFSFFNPKNRLFKQKTMKKIAVKLVYDDEGAHTADDESEASAPHTNDAKKIKVSAPKKVRASAPAKKKSKDQLEKETEDAAEIVREMGTQSQAQSTPSSGKTSSTARPETPRMHKGSVPFRLKDLYEVGVKDEEGNRTTTCLLCKADSAVRTMVVKNGQGFGNVGGHFRLHHFEEYKAHGCCEKGDKCSANDAHDDGEEFDELEELLFFFARLRLPFSVVNDKWMRRYVRAKKIFVDVETTRGTAKRHVVRQSLSALMDVYAGKLLDEVLKSITDKNVSMSMDNGTTQGVRTTAVTMHADGWSFPVKLLDCPLGKDGEDGRATSEKLEKDLRPFCSDLKDKYNLKLVSITTDNNQAIINAGVALAAGIPGCFHINCGCHVEQLFLKHGLLPLFELSWELVEVIRKRVKAGDPAWIIPDWVKTRWGSRLAPLRHILCDKNLGTFLHKNWLTEKERDDLRNVVCVLEPFEVSSKRLENPSACLFDTVISHTENMRQVGKVAHTNTLAVEFERVYMDYSFNPATTVAAGLMVAPFMSPNWAGGLTASHCRHFTNALLTFSAIMFGELAPDPHILRDEAAYMFDGRLMTPVLARSTKSLDDWFFKVQNEAPCLYDIFLRLRVTTASEADAERVYSDVGRIHTDDRNNLTVKSLESCLLVGKLQGWSEKLGAEKVSSSFFKQQPEDTWKDAMSSQQYALEQYSFFNTTERRMMNVRKGQSVKKGLKVKIWFVGHARYTVYTVRDLIGEKYVGGPNNGLSSGDEKGRWTLMEAGKVSQNLFDVAEDEWEYCE